MQMNSGIRRCCGPGIRHLDDSPRRVTHALRAALDRSAGVLLAFARRAASERLRVVG